MFGRTAAQALFSWLRERLVSGRTPEDGSDPLQRVVNRLSPQVGLTSKSVQMIEAGLKPAPPREEPEEPPLRGSLESRFPTTR